jgi:hypothetical protein
MKYKKKLPKVEMMVMKGEHFLSLKTIVIDLYKNFIF